MILNDREISELCAVDLRKPMITPFEKKQVRDRVISYGLSSFGYDIRIATEFMVFSNVHSVVVDPKAISNYAFVRLEAGQPVEIKSYSDRIDEWVDIPPNSFALGRSVEYFDMPRDVLGICLGKSTYARCGIVINVTPLEPGWKGFLTIEISNTTPLPARVYANEGIAQVIFLKGKAPGVSYADRQGKYQHSEGVVLPRV